MARPRQFDTRQALDQAMRVFWKKGYQGASLQDLLQAMELSKSSFYDTFGSKHELFLRALEHFHQTRAIYRMVRLDPETSPKTAIQHMFQLFLESLVQQRRGCLFARCALENPGIDPAAMERIARGIQKLEQTFLQLISQGQAMGEIPKRNNPRSLARSLTATFYGLQVMATADPNRERLNDVASSALRALD